VTFDDLTLGFDEKRLQGRLAVLEPARQLAFTASCCERAAATCIDYALRSDMGDEAKVVKDVTELAWRATLEPGAALKERSVANELWHFARMDNDWVDPMTTYIPDLVSAVYFAADFQLTRSLKSATECARWVFNALDALVLNRRGVTSGPSEEERQAMTDRTIQRELRKQENDLTALETANRIDAALVERLRAESARIGQLMLEEFEADAQRRLRRGPPPRIFPDPEPPA
jgi:uncharacterized protein YjaG (DUF416 family)